MTGFALILTMALTPGCAPVAVGTAAAIWYSIQGKEWCQETRKRPDLEAKLKDEKFRDYFEQTCGKPDSPAKGQ
ncbi:MAG: hypothetical protein OXF11_11600 [Deltaproteobacteria bacterium]|nr:hypothetical protein [Deltaproteobacteria bacterium]